MLAIVLQISHCICTNRLRLQNCSVCNHLRRWACDTNLTTMAGVHWLGITVASRFPFELRTSRYGWHRNWKTWKCDRI